MSKKRTWNKEKPRKLSLVELEERYGSTDAQIKFFLTIKWLEDFCHCHEYYLIKRTTEQQVLRTITSLSARIAVISFHCC